MEKGDSKVVIMETKPGTSRVLGSLAGAVALLAVSFIVLIACGTVVLNNNTCEQTNKQQESSFDVTQTYEMEYAVEEKIYSENIVMHPGRQMEYIVTRDAETGLVESVYTVDFNVNTTTMYSAKLNLCFMYRKESRDFDDVVRELHNEGKTDDKTSQRMTLDLDIGDKVRNVNNIPVEMLAFCTTTNTKWVVDRPEDDRTKRQTFVSCHDCVYTGNTTISGGVRYAIFWCVWCRTCNGCRCVSLWGCVNDYGFWDGQTMTKG